MSRFVLTAQLQLQAPNNVAQVVRQIQSQLNGVNINLNVQNSAQAQRQLQQVTAQTQAATSAADRMGRAFALSIRRFAAFSIATRAVSLFTSTLSSAVDTAIDFERQMIKISQVTGDSMQKLRGLTKSITDLSTGLGVSSASLLEASTLLLQAGISAKDTEVALKTLAKAALAPNFDSLSETTEGAIAILAQFGEGVNALEKQLGAINAVAGAFAVEAGDLIDVIRRAGGVFKSSGGDLNELIALFTSVRATTRESAESIGTGLRTIFTRIQRPKTIEFLKQFGVELVDLNGKFIGPFEAVKKLSAALSGLGEGDITFIRIAEELGGFRQIGKVLPLLQQFTVAQNALNVANKAGNSLINDAATAQQALAIRILKVKEEFLALVRGVTETQTFQVMANTALSLASALIKIGEAIKPLLPLLAAVAAVNFAKGIGTFAGGLMRGMQSGRTYNKGGKVHHFARGGMVPGSGNRDTVPAMLQPGEFVIRKNSVNKLGAGNLAAMNENRFSLGGKNPTGKELAQQLGPSGREVVAGKTYKAGEFGTIGLMESISDEVAAKLATEKALYGAVFLEPLAQNQFLEGKLDTKQISKKILGSNSYKSLQLFAKKDPKAMELLNNEVKEIVSTADKPSSGFNISLGSLSANTASSMKEGILQQVSDAVVNSAQMINNELGIKGAPEQARILKSSGIEATVGNIFEAAVTSASNREPFMGRDASADFDYPAGIGSTIGSKFGISPQAFGRPSDAKNFLNQDNIKSLNKKIANFETGSAIQQIDSTIMNTFGEIKAKQVKDQFSFRQAVMKKHFGGLVQKFAKGGMAQAPLIDDILSNAQNTILPRPGLAIQKLIESGGGFVDIDRTLKRTIGDQAYGRAKTSGQQSAALDKYFRDPQARLRDVMSAPLTKFGQELQTSIKSGQLAGSSIRVISKSPKTPGVAEYLSGIFGIPSRNFAFTSGKSKVPLMRKFATGGGVGTDTVPALLTPGEFVVNRASAQRIGYGNLHRMNKVGKYAKGGIVKLNTGGLADASSRYGAGFIGTGGLGAGQNLVPFDMLSRQARNLSQIQQQLAQNTQNASTQVQNLASSNQQLAQANTNQTRSIKDVVNNNKMFAASMATSLIAGFLPAIDNNSSAMLRLTHSMLGLVTAITSVGFALEAFGVTLNAKNIMEFFGSGPNSAGGLLSKGFKSVTPQLSSAIGSFRSGLNKRGNKLLQPITSSIGRAGSSIQQNINPLSTAFGRGFQGARRGISPLYAAAMPPGTQKMPGGTLGVQQLKTNISQLGFGGRLSAKAGGMLGSSNFGKGLFGGLSGKNVLGGGSSSLSGNLGGLLGQGIFKTKGAISAASQGVGGIQRGLVSGFQGGRFGQSGADIAAKLASRGIGQAGQMAAKFANVLGKGVTTLPKLLGPMMAIAGSAYAATEAFKAAISAVYNFEGRLNTAIEAGDVNKAKAVAGERATFEGANVIRGAGATAGAGIGFILGGPIGAAIGAALGAGAGTIIANGIIKIFGEEALDGLNTLFGGNTRDSAIALAAAQAGAVKTQKELDKAQKVATNAMEDFENGTLSASEALTKIRAATSEVQKQEKRASDFAISNLENRASDGFTGRNIASTLTFGMVESSSQRNQRLGQQSAEQIRQAAKFQTEAFQLETGARTANIKSGFARGKSRSEIESEATGDLRARRTELLQNAQKALRSGDEQSANAFNEAAEQLRGQIEQVEREMVNLEKEVARSKAALEAMNLGLRGPTATATAMSASMDRFASGLEVGGSMFVANTEFLSQAMTSAAQAMNPEDIKKAVTGVANNLQNMGIDPTKFRANTEAFIQAQQNYNKAFDKIRSNIQARRERGQAPGDTPDEIKKAFAQELTAGLGDEAKKNLTAIIENIPLSPDEVDKLLAGDLSVFGDKLTEAGQKQFEQIMKIAQERNKAEQVLIGFIKQRGEAERNLAAAQKESVDLFMEGRDVQAKYGGRAVTTEEKRAAIVAKANAGAGIAGIGAMRTGSVAELRARNAQTLAGFGRIEERRSTQGGMEGRGGVEAANTQQNLQQAQKDQIQTIRDLIKLEEEELKIIQEKNKMEKDSLEALISGDVEKFFEGQAAMGAQAAIAAGDTGAANMFGAKAVGQAFQDIQRQMEAGVQTMFGRQLGGAGGLAEQAAGAALGARGVMDPRMAQRLAGTTAAEEQSKARLRDLGQVLGETGMVGEAMAAMEVQTANINVTNATLELAGIEERGRQASQAAGMYRGGTVYANRGMFVPRGTDTVPAMLTPGEFVVRREAVNRGNNLQLLRAINSGNSSTGMARGGKVGYYNNGGVVQYKALGDLVSNLGKSIGIDPQMITNLGNIFNTFVNGFNESIKNLQNTKVQVQMAPTTVNVNFTGGGMLNQIADEAKQKLKDEIISAIRNQFSVGSNGKLIENNSNLARPGQGS